MARKKEKYCVICGCDISERGTTAKYCLECAKLVIKQKKIEGHKRLKEKKEKQLRGNKRSEISEITREARLHGYTYGKWVSMRG